MNKKLILIIIIIFSGGLFANEVKDILKEVKFEQKIGVQLDPTLKFIDENEKTVTRETLFEGKPGIFIFSYSQCKTLCPMVMNGLILELRNIKQTVGVDYNILFLSIDSKETQSDTKERKKLALKIYNRPISSNGWKFLRGTELQIQKAAHQLGFFYRYDPNSKQYAHPAGLIFLTPNGKVSSYLMGAGFQSKAIEEALKIAAVGKKGNLVEAILLYCFHYDPENGKYGSLIISSLRIAGVISLLAIFCGLIYLNRSKRRAM